VTTGVADDYNLLATRTQSLPWTDLNGDGIAQGESTVVNGTRASCVYRTAGCEINFANLSADFGTRALNEYGGYPRTWNLEQGIELQHELFPRLSVTGSWFHGAFHNLTVTVNRALQFNGDPSNNPFLHPVHHLQSGHRRGDHRVRAERRRGGLEAAKDNLDTFDPNREQTYDAYNLESGQARGGLADLRGHLVRGELNVNCTAPDDPNDLRFCNDRENNVPFRKNLKIAGSLPVGWGVTFSAALQSNSPFAATTDRVMTFTTGSTPVSGELCRALSGGRDYRTARGGQPDLADRRPGAVHLAADRADHPVGHQAPAHVPPAPRQSAADVRSVQPQQLGRDHQLPVDEHPVRCVPGAEQHHAAADGRRGGHRPMVGACRPRNPES
jgi:hypothetical protein